MGFDAREFPDSAGAVESEADFGPEVQRPYAHNERTVKAGRVALAVAVFFGGYSLLRFGSINLTVSDVAFLGCALILLMQGRLNLMPYGAATPFWLFGLMLMLGGLFLSTLANGDPIRWVIVAAQYLMAFLLIPLVLNGEESRFTQRLPVFYMLGITLSETIGIASFFLFTFQDTMSVFGDGFITGNGRIGAMSGEPNQNGAAVAFAFPMLIYALRKRFIPAFVGVPCGIILVWGVVLSASFTAFVASGIAIAVTLAIMGMRYFVRAVLALSLAGALFAASGAPLPKAFEARVGSAVTSGNLDQAGTFTDRSALAKEAWEVAEDTLLIGLGVDRYREVSPHGAPVHTLHLLMLTEGGAVASLGLLIVLALLVILALSRMREQREESGLAIAVVAVFLIYTLSVPHMYSRVWVMPVMLGLSTLYARRHGEAGRASSSVPQFRSAPLRQAEL